MRRSAAEQRGVSDNSKGGGLAGVLRSAIGYTTKSGGVMDRVDGNAKRSTGLGWEIRLGRLQVAVWLGLAVGACVGGYFVGFFSGRYVGFESARESSSSELPKLPAPDVFADASIGNPSGLNPNGLNPNGVYDRLKAPAILPDSGGPRASAKMAEVAELTDTLRRTQGSVVVDAKKADGKPSAQLVKEPVRDLSDAKSQNFAAADSVDDDLFGDFPTGERLIIGDEETVGLESGTNKVPSSVRLLGGDRNAPAGVNGKADQLKNEVVRNDSASSAAAILDARIANARGEAGRAAQASQVVPQESAVQKKAPSAPAEVPAEASSLVRKVLPAGYFAQVAAPKKLAEAEGVAKRLKKSGFPVVVESATVNGQSFYRVLVGPEENKVQAERLVSQLQSESFVASKPFIRKVK